MVSAIEVRENQRIMCVNECLRGVAYILRSGDGSLLKDRLRMLNALEGIVLNPPRRKHDYRDSRTCFTSACH